jgi:HAD superfamily phosphatase (TIGR01668 family)
LLEPFCPTAYYDSIYDIDFAELKKEGIVGLIIDLDNTLVARGSKETPNRLHEWLKKLEVEEFRVCIVSNNWASKVGVIAKKLNIPLVAQAGKPRRKAFKQGMRILGTNDTQTAVIGDQLFTDVLGGNRLGLVTILVVPIGTKELFYTKLLRHLERIILKKLQQKRMLVRT